MLKEMGVRGLLMALGIMVVSGLAVGSLLNLLPI
jgi:hypothetical protein